MLSSELELCLNQAFHQARSARHESLTVEHLLLAILDAPKVREVLESCGADLERLGTDLRQYVETNTPRLSPGEERAVQPTLGFQRVLQRAVFHVQHSGKQEVGVVNVLVAIFSEKQSHAVVLLARAQVTRLDVVNYITSGLRRADSRPADLQARTQAQAPRRIGFVGVGMMGAPMVRCLHRAGFEVLVADTDAARERQLTDTGEAQRLTSEEAGSLDALITMLPNSQIVERALLGEDRESREGAHDAEAQGAPGAAGTPGASTPSGAPAAAAGWARQLPRGAVVIDMSSSEPARSRRLGATLASLGLDYLDAPVSGGVRKAQAGTLAILVGGDAAVLERCRALLRGMGASVLHVGAAGTGHAAKALNNYVSAAGLVAAVEALHVAERFGIPPAVMTEVLNASTGRNNTTENKVSQFMLSGSFASGFTLQLMTKDLRTASALAQAVGYPLRLGSACVALWEEAARSCAPTTDHTEMYRLLAAEGPPAGEHSPADIHHQSPGRPE